MIDICGVKLVCVMGSGSVMGACDGVRLDILIFY